MWKYWVPKEYNIIMFYGKDIVYSLMKVRVLRKIDVGMIMLEVSAQDKEALADVLQKNGLPIPDIKISIYKNRRGGYKNILLWCSADRGCCRINPIFATNYNYQIMPIEDLDIRVKNE